MRTLLKIVLASIYIFGLLAPANMPLSTLDQIILFLTKFVGD